MKTDILETNVALTAHATSKTRLRVIKYQETAPVNRVGKEYTVQRILTNVKIRLFVLNIRCVKTQMVPFLVFVIQDILKLLENALVSYKKKLSREERVIGCLKNVTSTELKSKNLIKTFI